MVDGLVRETHISIAGWSRVQQVLDRLSGTQAEKQRQREFQIAKNWTVAGRREKRVCMLAGLDRVTGAITFQVTGRDWEPSRWGGEGNRVVVGAVW